MAMDINLHGHDMSQVPGHGHDHDLAIVRRPAGQTVAMATVWSGQVDG